MRCEAEPSLNPGTTILEILLGNPSDNNEIQSTTFAYYINPTIDYFYPVNGSSAGNVNVTLYGSNFFYADDNNMLCK